MAKSAGNKLIMKNKRNINKITATRVTRGNSKADSIYVSVTFTNRKLCGHL